MEAASAEEVRLEDMGIIDSEEAAVGCALKILEQSSRILSSTSGWSTLNKPKCVGVKLESKAATVGSATPTSQLPVIRSEGRVECSAEDLYELLISEEGYKLINPSADPAQFSKPFLGPIPLEPKDESSTTESVEQKSPTVQLEHTRMKVPVIADREFVVANVKDRANLTFSSSSVLSSTHPGGSERQSEMPIIQTMRLVRGVIAAAYSCQPISGEERACILRVWQWLDLGGWTPAAINRHGNVHWFPPAYTRIRAYVKNKG